MPSIDAAEALSLNTPMMVRVRVAPVCGSFISTLSDWAAEDQ